MSKAHRLLYHFTLGLRVIKKRRTGPGEVLPRCMVEDARAEMSVAGCSV